MLVTDASCLFEVITAGPDADAVTRRLAVAEDQVAPHIVDVEVFAVIRRQHLLGRLDVTAARVAVENLRRWPGERVGHQPLLDRAWELRNRVRGWDAMYIALAEALGVPLLTRDGRLARVDGLNCAIELV